MICDSPNYSITYGDLINKNWLLILLDIEKTYKESKEPTWSELYELIDYFSDFIEDINHHFKWNVYFYYQWWLPVRNKITWL